MLGRLIVILALCVTLSAAYVLPTRSITNYVKRCSSNNIRLYARDRKKRENDATLMINLPAGAEGKFTVGEDLPEDVKGKCSIYDMVLLERYSAPSQTDVGLFIPQTIGKDKKLVAKVLDVPSTYGLESEQGRVQSLTEIAPIKVGDVVLLQDPWGIGPLDIEVGGRCFSYQKAERITGIISSA